MGASNDQSVGTLCAIHPYEIYFHGKDHVFFANSHTYRLALYFISLFSCDIANIVAVACCQGTITCFGLWYSWIIYSQSSNQQQWKEEWVATRDQCSTHHTVLCNVQTYASKSPSKATINNQMFKEFSKMIVLLQLSEILRMIYLGIQSILFSIFLSWHWRHCIFAAQISLQWTQSTSWSDAPIKLCLSRTKINVTTKGPKKKWLFLFLTSGLRRVYNKHKDKDLRQVY